MVLIWLEQQRMWLRKWQQIPGEFLINIHFLNNYSDKERRLLERTANTCPVRNSLSDELAVEIHFNYPDK